MTPDVPWEAEGKSPAPTFAPPMLVAAHEPTVGRMQAASELPCQKLLAGRADSDYAGTEIALIDSSSLDRVREVRMPSYIMLSNWTDQGIRQIKDSPKRLDAARELCRQHGAEMTAVYMTMGVYDLVIIIEAPNDDDFARIALSIAKGGNIRAATLKAFEEERYRSITGSIG